MDVPQARIESAAVAVMRITAKCDISDRLISRPRAILK
jgi:hypothetical protein